MQTTYDRRRLKAGIDHNGNQKFRTLDVKMTDVDYRLPRITETVEVFDAESERTFTKTIERRPNLTVTTRVTVCRQHGVIRLYGPQGL
jgi:CRP-like cAMP-binding protein